MTVESPEETPLTGEPPPETEQTHTGPRTSEGKARSRCNALKHGLSGMGSVLPPDDHELFQERMLEWTAEEMPKGPIETYLLSAAALASVRMDRCARNEFSATLKLRTERMQLWQYNQNRRISRTYKTFKDDPRAARVKLTSFASGCGWLAEKWRNLLKAIDGEGIWTDTQLKRAVWCGPENKDA